jgi:hypothetical protein
LNIKKSGLAHPSILPFATCTILPRPDDSRAQSRNF